MRIAYLVLAIVVTAAAAAAADDGAPAVDTTPPPTEGSNGDSSNVDASQTEVLADPGVAPRREDPSLDTKLAGDMSWQELHQFYQETADSHAAALRKYIYCARWGVIAMQYANTPPKHAATSDAAPVDPFRGGVLNAALCGTLKSHGVGATVAYPGSKYPVWVVYLYRRFSTPPTRPAVQARNDIIGAATTCLAKNEDFHVVPPDDTAKIVGCIASVGRGNSDADYVVVTSQMRDLVATNFPPSTTIWMETRMLADQRSENRVYTFILQP